MWVTYPDCTSPSSNLIVAHALNPILARPSQLCDGVGRLPIREPFDNEQVNGLVWHLRLDFLSLLPHVNASPAREARGGAAVCYAACLCVNSTIAST
jgi:hypothetical protein